MHILRQHMRCGQHNQRLCARHLEGSGSLLDGHLAGCMALPFNILVQCLCIAVSAKSGCAAASLSAFVTCFRPGPSQAAGRTHQRQKQWSLTSPRACCRIIKRSDITQASVTAV